MAESPAAGLAVDREGRLQGAGGRGAALREDLQVPSHESPAPERLDRLVGKHGVDALHSDEGTLGESDRALVRERDRSGGYDDGRDGCDLRERANVRAMSGHTGLDGNGPRHRLERGAPQERRERFSLLLEGTADAAPTSVGGHEALLELV